MNKLVEAETNMRAAIEALVSARLEIEVQRLTTIGDLIADERDRTELSLMEARSETALWVNAYDAEVVRRKRVEALADEWEAAGTVSVYESAAELAEMLRAALQAEGA